MLPSHEWVDSILENPEFRAKFEQTAIAADTYMASQLAQNLMQLRNQQRSNAYRKIFEARARVADDLLALQNSLSELIHYSAVAGENTKIFVSLQNSVVTVTQKLSAFGEDDMNGDGMRDGQAQAPGTPLQKEPGDQAGGQPGNAPSLDLEIDKAPMAPDNQPEPKANQVLPADQVQQDPDDVTDENAEVPGAPKKVATPSPAHEGDNIDGPAELPDAPADEESAEKEAPADEGGFDTSTDEEGADDEEGKEGDDESADQDNPDAEKPAAEEGAQDPDSDEAAPDEEETSENQSELHKEFSGVAKKAKAKGGKKGLFESLTSEDAPKEAAASVAPAKPGELNKPVDNFRFVYRGVRGECVSALITNKIYYFKPTAKLFNGDVDKLNVALREYLEQHPGYMSVMQKLNALKRAGKLTVIKRIRLSKQQLRASLHAPEQMHGQLGSVVLNEGTSWRYRGVGLQKVSNQDVCLWLEVGDLEYGLVPNKKVFGEKTIEEVDGPIQGRLKKLSYTEGLSFMLKLVHMKKLNIIFQGKIAG